MKNMTKEEQLKWQKQVIREEMEDGDNEEAQKTSDKKS